MELLSVTSLLVLGGGFVSVLVSIAAWRAYPNPMAMPIGVLTLAAAVWAIPVGIGFHVTDPGTHVWLQRVRYLGTAAAPVAYYLVAFRYAGYERYVRPRVVAGLAVIPVMTLLLVWSWPAHELFWQEFTVNQVGDLSVAAFEYGPWFWIHLLWAYGLMGAGFLVLTGEVLRADALHRKQALVVFLGGAIPFLLNVGFYVNIGPAADIDITATGIGVGGGMLGIGLLVFDLVELRPVARKRLIEELRDGVVVVDPNDRIRETNPVAKQIIEEQGMDPAIDTELGETFTPGKQIQAEVNGETRWYRIEPHTFHDRSGEIAGRILYLNDHTEVARREQRISVLHRVLRHNIRNEMTVLLGHLEYAQKKASPDIENDLQTVEQAATRIMGFAENARLIEETLKGETKSTEIDIHEALAEAIDMARGRTATQHIEVHRDGIPEGATLVSEVDQELLARAISELIENAIVHGSSGDEPVAVRLRQSNGWLDIEVVDSGPGIPEAEINALESSVETALEHGSGLGLWVVRWTAELTGGELTFPEEDRNVVGMRIPYDQP